MSDEFKKRETNAEELLRQVVGETRDDAIKKWWAFNGLVVDYDKRKAEYERQRIEAMNVYNRVRYRNDRTISSNGSGPGASTTSCGTIRDQTE